MSDDHPGGWEHRICERCWINRCSDGYDGQRNGAIKVPVQFTGATPDVCCYCGQLTVVGIRMREKPRAETLLCWQRPPRERLIVDVAVARLQARKGEIPAAHQHTYPELIACCMEDGALDVEVMQTHEGTCGEQCDVTRGPCACGEVHGGA